MSSGAEYVVAAYGVILFALVMYAVVVGMRAARLARESELLSRLAARGPRQPAATPERHLEPADT